MAGAGGARPRSGGREWWALSSQCSRSAAARRRAVRSTRVPTCHPGGPARVTGADASGTGALEHDGRRPRVGLTHREQRLRRRAGVPRPARRTGRDGSRVDSRRHDGGDRGRLRSGRRGAGGRRAARHRAGHRRSGRSSSWTESPDDPRARNGYRSTAVVTDRSVLGVLGRTLVVWTPGPDRWERTEVRAARRVTGRRAAPRRRSGPRRRARRRRVGARGRHLHPTRHVAHAGPATGRSDVPARRAGRDGRLRRHRVPHHRRARRQGRRGDHLPRLARRRPDRPHAGSR